MLFLVGIGLTNRELNPVILTQLRNAEMLLDPYTNFIDESDINYLEGLLSKGIKRLERSDLEENSLSIVRRAKNSDIAILVSGDPLIATTHHTILDLAKQEKVAYKVSHASNVFSAAIGESGLDIYKFGPTTTVTFWAENYRPVSFIDVIKKNQDNEQHTLCLLDYHYKEKRRMKLAEAVQLLHVADDKQKYGLTTEKTKLLLLGDLGKETQTIRYVSFENMNKELLKEFEGKIICIIFPGKMNFAEEEALKKFEAI